jgi:glutamine synthetase
MATVTGDQLERVRAEIEEHGIHTVECAFPDTWGHIRGKRVPTGQFLRSVAEKGYATADAAFIWDMRCDIFDTPFTNAETGYGDMQVVPDLETFRPISWREGTALVICDCVDEAAHAPVAMDPRHLLRRQIERCRGHGFEPTVASELEFYLCSPDWQPLYPDVQCYSLLKGAELEHVMVRIRHALEAYGIVVEASNTEYGPAQIEVNMGHGPALSVADNTMVFKYVVKEIALQQGVRATFMAKPFAGFSGNGMHIHQSLERDGANALAERTDDGPLANETMRRWVAGLVTHARELTLLGCPTINSYKRVEDYSFAPVSACWGLDNRGVCVRCLPQSGAATRIEYRGAAADANPYLVIAAMLSAGLDGLERQLELPPAQETDPYADTSKPRLPRSLGEAIAAFAGGSFGRETFGEVFTENFLVMTRHEAALYETVITEWERDRYVEYA